MQQDTVNAIVREVEGDMALKSVGSMQLLHKPITLIAGLVRAGLWEGVRDSCREGHADRVLVS